MKSQFGTVDKRVPESKKYAHVGSNIDTGATAKNVSVVSTSATAKKRNEIFKRIKCSTLARLLEEREVNESVYALGSVPEDNEAVSVSSVKASKAPGIGYGAASVATAATCQSAVGSVVSVCDSDMTVDQNRDLVLLDLRDETMFGQCRLPMAISYPATMINRDQFTAELHRCKRDASKLLVVYHTNDATTAGVATLLAQKGWENVHALSGGFEEMASSYPEVFEGEMPERPATGASAASNRTSASRR